MPQTLINKSGVKWGIPFGGGFCNPLTVLGLRYIIINISHFPFVPHSCPIVPHCLSFDYALPRPEIGFHLGKTCLTDGSNPDLCLPFVNHKAHKAYTRFTKPFCDCREFFPFLAQRSCRKMTMENRSFMMSRICNVMCCLRGMM